MNVHKNPRLTPQGRLLLVERITQQGWSVRPAAQAAGPSTNRAHHLRARYRGVGSAALPDRSSAPQHRKNRTSAERITEIEGRWRQRLSGPAIARQLGIPVSTVGKALRRLVLVNLVAVEPKAPVVPYPRERPGELIHIDVKKLGRIKAIATGGAVPVENTSTSVSMMPCLAYSEIRRDERKESAVPFLERALA